jgi:nucleolin
MSDEKELTKRILAALNPSDEFNVKKLRKQILLQLQTDSDDKAAKKTFKKAIKILESDGKLTLDKEGTIKLVADSSSKTKAKKKDKKSKDKKKEKKDKKSKRKKTEGSDDEDAKEEPTKKLKTDDGDEEGSEGTETEDPPNKNQSSANPADKNKPCPGNPSGYTRLFLGNLPFAVDEASLRTFLSPAIMTHVKWITDKETGKFYGSAFIEMDTSESGAIAVKEKNGEKIMGRPIRINFAPSREGDIWPPKSKEVTGNGGQAGGSGVKAMSEKPEGCVKLFVGNLSFEIDDDTIIKFFANVDAEVKAVRWLHHRDSGDFKGCGYVEFWKTEACEKGATLNGKTLMGRPIRIDWTD